MGTIDISRINFDAKKHYSGVKWQQGRVQLGADNNEQSDIMTEDERRSRVDIIGPFGSPDEGFKIAETPGLGGLIDGGRINFTIKAGTLYLGGSRLELEEDETYRLQKDWLQQPDDLDEVPEFTGTERFDLVFLENWHQPVTAVEDASLFEVALGGPDTTARIRAMRRVHLASDIGFGDCAEAWQQLIGDWETAHLGKINKSHERITDAKLKVTFSKDGLPEDLCTPTAVGGYLGAENQAIRVQIVGKNEMTWGFDNASPIYRVTVADGKTVHMLTEPKDQYHWPLSNQIVEILPWSAVLSNGEKVAEQMGHLTSVKDSFDPDSSEFTLVDPVAPDFGNDWKNRSDKDALKNQKPPEYFYMRIWNRGNDLTSKPKIDFVPGTAVKLGNTGLEVTITGDDIVVSDHWVIAARPETPNRVVPWELEQGMAPHGVRRFFAPLAVIQWKKNGREVEGEIIHDCRKIFQPLTDLETCCTYHVGDGLHSHGDFNSIEEAVQNLPDAGGKICVLPGEHLANVSLINKTQIQISGCGERSIIRPHLKQIADPIFLIAASNKIQLDNLSLIATKGSAIEVVDPLGANTDSREISIKENRIIACIHAIRVHLQEDVGGNNEIYIGYNRIGMIDKEEGEAAIFSIADGVLIERNRIVVVPPPDPDNPDDPRDDPEPPGGFFDPCADPTIYYGSAYPLQLYFNWVLLYVMHVFITKQRPIIYRTTGGIQIGGTSERVRIIDNIIIGGAGNGVTLGHLPDVRVEPDPADFNRIYKRVHVYSEFPTNEVRDAVYNEFNNFIYEIDIDGNHIDHMGLSGVGVVAYFSREKIELAISVEDLKISRNSITRCAHQVPDTPDEMVDEVAYGGITLSDAEEVIITENRIEDNGNSQVEPVCGICFLYGEKIDISNNRILNNGPQISENEDLERGLRGGIVIKTSFKAATSRIFGDTNIISPDGVPAVKIHDNIVTQPAGQALYIIALGPVSVVGNQLTSQGADYRVNPTSLLAGTVFIFNLGLAQDLFWFMMTTGLQDMTKQSFGSNFGGESMNKVRLSPFDNNLVNRILYWPSGEVLFANNQTTLDLRHKDFNLAVSSQLIVSLDDVAYNSNQSQCISLFDIIITNTFIIAFSIRSNDNRFEDGQFLDFLQGNRFITLYSLLSIGFMNTALGNQSTHCLLVLGVKVPPDILLNDSNMVLFDNGCQEFRKILQSRLGIEEMG